MRAWLSTQDVQGEKSLCQTSLSGKGSKFGLALAPVVDTYVHFWCTTVGRWM